MIREVIHGDALVKMDNISDKSVDLIFTDLPYETTKASWDKMIPLNDYIHIVGTKGKMLSLYKEDFLLHQYKFGYSYEESLTYWHNNHRRGLWSHYNRIIKDNGAILLFGQSPFDKILGASNLKMLRYEWIWEKTQATGFYNAKKMPMKAHENILVFYKKPPTYNPQKTEGHDPINTYTKKAEVCNKTELYGKVKEDISGGGETDRYPRSVQIFSSDKQKTKLDGTIFSTQKPIELIKYMIKTYTNEGDIVLDSCAGSGTVAVGCEELGRQYIVIEKEEKHIEIINKRLKGCKCK